MLAFPIHLFEIYRQIHRVCPRYSIGALSTTLTNLHHCPRHPGLAEHLSSAYDAYLEILRQVDARVDLAMGRDAAWYIRNICAPCLYKLENEPPLRFSWLGCMDGNNSLKLVDATFRAGSVRPDNRASTSFRWLTPEQVDVFKDEVENSQKVTVSISNESYCLTQLQQARAKKKTGTSQPVTASAAPTTFPEPPSNASLSTTI
ncbi:hypothetical protein C8J57DRAFT_1092435 [Mycena rebaudengoi]|nr:hypothetical protein C8J57DRAFT_1092435 [Mycena rebaudengoi]